MEKAPVPYQNIPSQPSDHSIVLEQLEKYSELSRQCEHYERLLENTEKHRETVRSSIYEKVKEEYAARRRELQQILDQEQSRLLGEIDRFLQEREELKVISRETRDRLEEMEFRARVGEFPEEEVSEDMTALKRTLQEHTRSLGRLEEVLGKCMQLGPTGGGQRATSSLDSVQEPRTKPGAGFNEEPQAISLETAREGSQSRDAESHENSFVVVEEGEAGGEEECPVVHCPGALLTDPSQATASQEISSYREMSNGFVSGYLCALEGSRKGTRFPLICSDITLGKSPGIDIRLLDAGIANFHARIVYKGRKYFLENLDPMGRSFVNGVQADTVELKDSDLIRLGEIKMRVEFAHQSAEALTAQAA